MLEQERVHQGGSLMPSTGSVDRLGHVVEPIVDLSAQAPHQAAARQLDGRLLDGFLIGYRNHTRAAYLADLRDFRAWCASVGMGLLMVSRSHVQAYVRQLEEAGRSRATVARRLATLAGFYRYAVQEGRSPTPPPPTFVVHRWHVIRRHLGLTARKRPSCWLRPRPPRPATTPLPVCSS
jgi:integrase